MKYQFILCIGFALFASGYAIKCYNCESRDNKNCADPFNATSITLREYKNGTYCVKEVIKTTNSTYIMRRSSQDSSLFGIETTFKKFDGDLIESSGYYCKNKDECNGASSISIALATLMVAATTYLCIN